VRGVLAQYAAAELGEELPGTSPPPRTPFGFLENIDQLLGEWSVHHKKGTLAHAGGWRDQPAEWRDGILTLNAMYTEEYERIRRAMKGRR
jgi:hypothetical protein